MSESATATEVTSAERRNPERTRRRLIQSTVAILEREGEAGVRVADVARDAGMSIGAIYSHYRDRDDLVAAARAEQFRGRVAQDAAELRALLEAGLAPDRFAAAILDSAIRPDDPARIPFRWERVEAVAAARHRPALAVQIEAAQREFTEAMIAVIERAQELGLLEADVDPRALALLVQAVPFGFVLADLAPDVAPTGENWLALVARLGSALFTSSAAPDPPAEGTIA